MTASLALVILSKGYSTAGSKAVAGMGMASVIHQNAIRTAHAPARLAGTLIEPVAGKIKMIANTTNPATSPVRLR